MLARIEGKGSLTNYGKNISPATVKDSQGRASYDPVTPFPGMHSKKTKSAHTPSLEHHSLNPSYKISPGVCQHE